MVAEDMAHADEQSQDVVYLISDDINHGIVSSGQVQSLRFFFSFKDIFIDQKSRDEMKDGLMC